MHPSGPRHGPSVNSPSDQSFSSLASAGKNLPPSANVVDAARSEKRRTRRMVNLRERGIVPLLRRRVNKRRDRWNSFLANRGTPLQRTCKEAAKNLQRTCNAIRKSLAPKD